MGQEAGTGSQDKRISGGSKDVLLLKSVKGGLQVESNYLVVMIARDSSLVLLLLSRQEFPYRQIRPSFEIRRRCSTSSLPVWRNLTRDSERHLPVIPRSRVVAS